MNLNKLEDKLHHGFHDSRLYKIDINYTKGCVFFELDVLCNCANEDNEYYVRARLIFYGVEYFVMEYPHHGFKDALGIDVVSDIDILDQDFSRAHSYLLPKDLPDDTFHVLVYVSVYNNDIYLAANKAMLEWIEMPPPELTNINDE